MDRRKMKSTLQIEVANTLNVSQCVISRLTSKFQNMGNVVERQRTGWPRVTTAQYDR